MEKSTIKTIMESDNKSLAQEYAELLIARITHSSMSLEKDLGNIDDSKNAIRFRDNMKAFKCLLAKLYQQEDLTEETIIQVADMINESSPYVSRGYRTRGDYITDTNIPISSATNIPMDMNLLLRKHKEATENQHLNPFIREAIFHMDFIRIHPFEDGNGRTGRLLLNYNLLKEGIAPVIITDDLTEYYQSYIKNQDIEGMANLFSIQSKKEQGVVEQLLMLNDMKEEQTEIEIPTKRR